MKEADIRPRDLFEDYIEVSRRDSMRLLSQRRAFESVDCPACGSADRELAFKKWEYSYQQCRGCETLYLSPRPTAAGLDDFYREAESVRFWSTDFYRRTAEARREKLFRPRAAFIAELVARHLSPQPEMLLDIGAGYGLFLEEVAKTGIFRHVAGVEPAADLAGVCREKGFEVVESAIENVDHLLGASVVTAFEVLEHVAEPLSFVAACAKQLRPGGLLVLTTLSSSGFDLLTLWDRSKSIYPPHHINIVSVEGISTLMARADLEIVELTTPGQLDVELVHNAQAGDGQMELPRFVSYMLRRRDTAVLKAFQAFLRDANLSSHVRCVARKRTDDRR